MIRQRIERYFEEHADELLGDICALVRIQSDRQPPAPGMPYGEGPARALAAALEKFFAGKKVLFVFSTDLSHFHPYTEAVKMDQKLLRLIGDRDLARIGRLGHAGEIEACGLGPVITSLFLAERMGWEGPRLLKYANSGDVTGEKSSVVGYAAMSYRKE